jgi:U6 snRNA-associated Sm-like protein LSm1
MVLEETCERRMCLVNGISHYCDVPMGLYVIRGDSMVLLGQVDGGEAAANNMKEVELDELMAMIKESGTGAINWDFDADLEA